MSIVLEGNRDHVPTCLCYMLYCVANFKKFNNKLAKMIPIFMMFAGGPLGSGKQWFSWIHIDDLVNMLYEALLNPSYKGVINGTAPNPVRLAEMCEHLGSVLGRPSWLPVLEGQRVVPARAKELGFSY
nr:epimerase family protein SDR39U1 homolog, chloroplastic [Tanacetum cinerariifolium]